MGQSSLVYFAIAVRHSPRRIAGQCKWGGMPGIRRKLIAGSGKTGTN
jgi:hypothetical protein